MPSCLDLFCGLGGWSDGLALEGFDVLGVEIEPKIAELYKHPCLVADVRELHGEMFQTFDFIVGSPPCRDFSILTRCGKGHIRKNGTYYAWKIPPNPQKGLELVNAFLRIVKEAKPKFWLMENVPQLKEYFNVKPIQISQIKKGMYRAFWGDYPPFLVPMESTSRSKNWDKGGNKLRSWVRAKIPLPIARALGKAVKEALT